MDIIKSIKNFPSQNSPLALTIGMFDGCHLGHKKVIDTLLSVGKKSAVFTYTNHPKSVLSEKFQPLIQSPEDKLHRLKTWGVDFVIQTDFTREFANTTPESFLQELYQHIPFSHLILGYDTHIGKGRSANHQHIKEITKNWGVEVIVVEEEKTEQLTISSSRLREAIQNGDLDLIKKLLGRPLSYYGHSITGEGMGKKIGFPTLNFPVKDLILPPLGVYGIHYKVTGTIIPGIANLGLAPTIKNMRTPLLEVHLFSECDFTEPAEVIFNSFVRPEMSFNSIEELQQQIQKDIYKITS